MIRWFLALAVSLVLLVGARAEMLSGQVVGVHDGDTLTVLVAEHSIKVRLAEIDAPELRQAFGSKARQYLADLVFQKTVQVEVQGIDRFGRTIGSVLVGGASVNRALVAAGLAWHYKAFSKDVSFGELEATARAAGWGLWADAKPLAPWEFRRIKK